MSKTKSMISISIISALVGVLAACGEGRQAVEATSSNEASLVTRLDLADGTVVEFHEPVPGQLVVATWADAKSKLAAVDAKRLDSSAARLYEALSGEAAPAALVELDSRVEAAQLARPMTPTTQNSHVSGTKSPAGPATPDGIGVKTSALTASEFQSAMCQTSPVFDFKFCYTDISGYSAATHWSTSIHSMIWANSGTVVQRMDIRNLFWFDTMQWTVPENNWFHMYSVGGFTERFVQAWGGANYHHSIFGTTPY